MLCLQLQMNAIVNMNYYFMLCLQLVTATYNSLPLPLPNVESNNPIQPFMCIHFLLECPATSPINKIFSQFLVHELLAQMRSCSLGTPLSDNQGLYLCSNNKYLCYF